MQNDCWALNQTFLLRKVTTAVVVATHAGMKMYKIYSVKKDAFPQHNISNAEYKEMLIITYSYKYTFGLAVVGG